MNYFLVMLKPIIFQVLLLAGYSLHGQQQNASYGYRAIELDIFFAAGVLLSLGFSFLIFNRRLDKPSDFFVFFYSYIVFFPYVVLHGVWGREGLGYIYDLLMLVLPIFFVVISRHVNVITPKFYLLKDYWLLVFLGALTFLFSLYFIVSPTLSASFSVNDAYTRRLEARELYGSGTLVSYASSIITNGLLPLFVFIGVMIKRFSLVCFSFLILIIFYYVFGIKAPLVYIVASGGLAIFLTFLSLSSSFKFYYYILIFILVASLIEVLVVGGYYLELYLVRRVFYVGSYLVGAYFELFNSVSFDTMFGLGGGVAASVYVGETYLNSPELNANTNTYLYFLVQYGLVGYFFVNLFVASVFGFFDSVCNRSYVYAYLAFIYAILIIEQSATTALLSSGVGVITILYYFSKPSSKLRYQDESV